MKYFFGETPQNQLNINHDMVMDSALYYYTKKDPKIKYNYNTLFMDSGGYALINKDIDLDKDRILDIQSLNNPDYVAPLDYPANHSYPDSVNIKRWNITLNNTEYWVENTTMNVVPVVHAWNSTVLIDNLKSLSKFDTEFIGIGRISRLDRILNKELLNNLMVILKFCKENGFKTHFFGFGSSPITYHLGAYMGFTTTDSVGFKLKAINNKILIPDMGECDVNSPIKKYRLEQLKTCECPICEDKNIDEVMISLKENWINRAIHNKWIIDDAVRKFHSFDCRDDYRLYLDEIMQYSNYKHIWQYVSYLM